MPWLRRRRVHIPKPGRPGQTRPLGIPTVSDRVVMAVAKIVLEPIFEADFSPVSFGFRPKRSAQQAVEAVRVAANQGRVWVLDADIKACFDTIDHDALLGQFQRRVVDRRMLTSSPAPPIPPKTPYHPAPSTTRSRQPRATQRSSRVIPRAGPCTKPLLRP